jgi:hypothetical protein
LIFEITILYETFYFLCIIKMPFAKKSDSTVHVETKKMSGEYCGSGKCCGMGLCHIIGGLLLLANLIVLIVFFCQYNHMEAMKVGGSANYKLVKQIYRTKAFKDGQTQQIQQALQQYQTPATTPTATQPTTAQPTVQVAPAQ